MASPVTLMAGAGLASSVASAGIGAYGAYQGGKAKEKQYQYQAGIARMNQQIQEQNASYALESGDREVQQVGMKHRALMGKIRSQQAASGVRVDSGSNADVQAGANMVARMDQDNTRRNTMQKVRGYKIAAWEQGENANLADVAARNARKEGKTGVLTSLIGGASSVSSKWMQGKQAGVWG